MITIRISPADRAVENMGRAWDTERIQEAIDSCFRPGGGTVLRAAGAYVTGTLRLKSHVTLCLARGAWLAGSADIADYPDNESCFTDAVGHRRGRALLYAAGAEDIGLEGEGTIDGRGGEFPPEHPAHMIRPFLIRLVQCRDVRIRGLELRQSAAWCLHLQECGNAVLEELKIFSRCNGNNDGIDIDGCSRARIRNCCLDTGDDAICLKATGTRSCEQISVTGCLVSSGWSAFKIGTESVGDFREIEVADCVFYDVKGCAVKVVPVDGGSVDRLYLHDIRMINCTGPVFFSQGERLRRYFGVGKERPGRISHVSLERIKARAVSAVGGFYQGKPWGNARGCVVFSGLEGLPMEDVSLRDCVFEMPGGVREEVSGKVPEMGGQYPEFHLFDPLPCWGMYLRHVDRVRCDRVRMVCREPDVRPVTAWEDAENIDCGQLDIEPATVRESVGNAACGESEASAMTAEKDAGNTACREPEAGTEKEDAGNVCE